MTEHKLITHIALVLVGNLVESLSDVQLGLDDMEEGEDLLVAVRIEREQNIFLCILVERGSAAAATARAVKLSFTLPPLLYLIRKPVPLVGHEVVHPQPAALERCGRDLEAATCRHKLELHLKSCEGTINLLL